MQGGEMNMGVRQEGTQRAEKNQSQLRDERAAANTDEAEKRAKGDFQTAVPVTKADQIYRRD